MLEFKFDTQLLIEGHDLDEDAIFDWIAENIPGDSLLAVGTTEQIGRLRTMLETSAAGPGPAEAAPEFEVMNVTLREDSYLTGQTLRGTNMRDYRCMVISVLHGGEFITNPRPDYRFEAGDVVWIAGETSSCDWLLGARE